MKILFLSFHYPPDLSACSFRSQALSKALLESDRTLDLHVLTTTPHRYPTYSLEAPFDEVEGRLRIRRIELPPHGSGTTSLAWSALHYFRRALATAKLEQYDLIVATSSRIMTAVLGAIIARQQDVPLYLDIRDIFSQNLPELFPRCVRPPLRRIAQGFESVALTQACRVNLNSEGFSEYFLKRYPHQTFTFHTNGVDEIFRYSVSENSVTRTPSRALNIVYAGNLGAAQALHVVLPQLALRLASSIRFSVYGDGARVKALREEIRRLSVMNIEIFPPISREELPAIYQQADILFLHLADWRSCNFVLPSKLFEYIASGKPIWAGVNGWPRRFINEHCLNAAVFDPCNTDQAVETFAQLRLGTTDSLAFSERFCRRSIMKLMASEILESVSF